MSNVKAIFSHLDCLVDAIDGVKSAGPRLRRDGLCRVTRSRLICEASPVRWFTLTGAIFGGTMGFSLCSLTHLNWPMIIPTASPW